MIIAKDEKKRAAFFRILGYCLFSVAFGIFIVFITNEIEGIILEGKLMKISRQEVENLATAYKYSADEVTPDQTVAFLRNYITFEMNNKLATTEVSKNKKKRHFKYLFTYTNGPASMDVYIKKSYIRETVYTIDADDILKGIIGSVIVFSAILFYNDSKMKSRAMRRRHEAETEELTKTLQKHEALALLGRMTATLAHELKTPIATISNLVHTLPSRMRDEKFTKRFVAIANEELLRTQQLIDNLLIYGKDIPDTNDEWIDLEKLAGEICGAMPLNVRITPGLEINGDRFYIRLFFENLFRNSLQAGANVIDIRAEELSPVTEILVEDNGVGYPAGANLPELISPFFTSRSSGAGLGLFLAQKIAIAHDGMITLYRPARGAGIKISLPSEKVRVRT